MRRAQLSVRRPDVVCHGRRSIVRCKPKFVGRFSPDAGHSWLRAGLLHSADAATVDVAHHPRRNSPNSGGYGLPFAYDPLWRHQTLNPVTGTSGYYLGDGYNNPGVVFEARFGSGIGFIRNDPSDNGLPSAHGLQRVTNFNRPGIQPVSFSAVPSTFVSQEDVVWVEALQSNVFSPVLPDLQLKSSPGAPSLDWRYSWMFTGYQVSSAGGATFEGNIVIFENRPFGISAVGNPPNANAIPTGTYQVDGETVVEAIFGHSANIVPAGGPGYGAGADRTVLLRWYSSVPDPVVKPGDWIADVTYERNAAVVISRFQNNLNAPPGVPNPFHNNELDNLPAQRCFWYQVQKVIPAIDDPYTATQNLNPPLRSMVVTVDRSLIGRTVLSAGNAGGLQRGLDFALRGQRDSPAVYREVK